MKSKWIRKFAVVVLLIGPAMPSPGQMRQDTATLPPPTTQTFPLTDVTGLIAKNVVVKPVEYKGRKAVLVTSPSAEDGVAVLPPTDFQGGTIEAGIPLKISTPPAGPMPGLLWVPVSLWPVR